MGRAGLWTRSVTATVSAAMVVVLVVGGCSQRTPDKGEDRMDQNFYKALDSLKPADDKGLEALAVSAVHSARERMGTAIGILHNAGEKEDKAVKARMFLLQSGGFAIGPLLDSLNPSNHDALAWDVRTAVHLHREQQARIVKALEPLLDDKRELTPPPQFPGQEEKPAKRRVCDEAYLAMRALLALEDDDASVVNTAIFLSSMTMQERDEEIGRMRASRQWVALSEQAQAFPDEQR